MYKEDELNGIVEELINTTAADRNFSWGSFLLTSVHKCADEETIAKMIADIKQYINLRKNEPEKFV